jgi:prepilin-type processing-associated H-X9-DG protein
MSGIIRVILIVGIVLVLIGILIPAIRRGRDVAARVECTNNLHQIVLASHNYETQNDHFPPATMENPDLPPEKRLSWFVHLLPYIESSPLYSMLDKKAAWDAAQNHDVVTKSYKPYLCPPIYEMNRPDLAVTCFVGMTGVGTDAAELPKDSPRAGVFGYDRITKFVDIKDGMSNTIMVMETDKELGPWAAGGAATTRCLDPDLQPYVGANRLFGRKHVKSFLIGTPPTTANAAFADGSVRNLRDDISAQVLEGLVTIAGGEDVDYKDY